MKIVFFGTPDYVIPVLNTLHKNFQTKKGEPPIAAVVTQEPKPTGRKKLLEYSAVDKWAHKENLPIFFKPKNLLESDISADIGVLASYGKIIPQSVIDYFPYGIINIHPSLLPVFRGASPVQATLITETNPAGVTIMKLDAQLDHGQIINQFTEDLLKDDTTPILRSRLFSRAAEVLADLIEPYIRNKIRLKEQDHSKATYTKQITKEDAFIPPHYLDAALTGKEIQENWQINFIRDSSLKPNADSIDRFIRAMSGWPNAWSWIVNKNSENQTFKSIKRLIIHKAHPEEEKLIPDQVQLEGKSIVSWRQFQEGYPDWMIGD